MPTPRKKAEPKPKASELSDALKRAEAAEAEIAAMKAARADDDSDDDGDEEDEVRGRGGRSRSQSIEFNPMTHVIMTVEDHHILLIAKTDSDKRAQDQITATRQQQESLFTGFSAMSEMSSKQREADLQFANAQRDHAALMSREMAAKDMELSKMIRQSEDAALERQRLAADVERQRMAVERLQMELESKERLRQIDLNALQTSAAPVFNSLAVLLKQYGTGFLGGMMKPGAQTAAGLPASNTPAPKYRVRIEDTVEFRGVLLETISTLQPQTLAYLRALACSNLLGAHGAPPVPPEVSKNLIACVQQDAGEDKVRALLQACATAYVEEATAPSTSQPLN